MQRRRLSQKLELGLGLIGVGVEAIQHLLVVAASFVVEAASAQLCAAGLVFDGFAALDGCDDEFNNKRSAMLIEKKESGGVGERLPTLPKHIIYTHGQNAGSDEAEHDTQFIAQGVDWGIGRELDAVGLGDVIHDGCMQ